MTPRYMNMRFTVEERRKSVNESDLTDKMWQIYGDFGNIFTPMTTIDWLIEHSFTVAVVDKQEGRIVGFGGLQALWPGVARAWFVLLRGDIPTGGMCMRRLVKTCSDVITNCAKEWGLHRVDATVAANWKQGLAFARHFGFKSEGTLHKFSTNKGDYKMMSRNF